MFILVTSLVSTMRPLLIQIRTGAVTTAHRSRARRSAQRLLTAPGSTLGWGSSTRYEITKRSHKECILIYLQILAGPAFVAVFSVSGVLISVLSDKLKASVSRVLLVGIGTAVFSSGILYFKA